MWACYIRTRRGSNSWSKPLDSLAQIMRHYHSATCPGSMEGGCKLEIMVINYLFIHLFIYEFMNLWIYEFIHLLSIKPLNLATPGTYQLTQLQLQYLYYHVRHHIVRNTDHKILQVFLLWLMSGSVYLVLNQSLGLVMVHRNHEWHHLLLQ